MPGGLFDVVVCSDVLERVPSYESSLKEIVRRVSQRGFVFVSLSEPSL